MRQTSSKLMRVLSLVALCQMAFVYESAAGDERSISAELLSSLQQQDTERSIEMLNEIKRSQPQPNTISLISDLWHERTDLYPDLPWKFVNRDAVRLELADILIQDKANGGYVPAINEVHAYVRSKIHDRDPLISNKAVMALGFLEDPRDVIAIADIARQENPRTFRASVLTLSRMCGTESVKALSDLVRKVGDKNREYVRGAIAKSDSLKTNAKWCGSS